MREHRGLSLLELVVLLAVLGVVLSLSPGILNPDRQAVGQAAQGLAAQVTRARLEAIRQNAFAGLKIIPDGQTQVLGGGAGGYAVFVDRNGDRAYNPGEEVHRVVFGQGDWARVRLVRVSGGDLFLFDTRGVPVSFVQMEVTLGNRQGTYTKTVRISPQGRAEIP